MSASIGAGPAASAAVVDHSARERVVHDVGSTMFVEASAGTGKTTALVGRIVELVSGEHAVPISAIAAITFTEKAAAELRNRIRAELNARLAGSQDARTCQQLRDALDGLDSAAISTLHSFARRILSEHPIEAGLPPLFETLDQITSDVEFDDRWRSFVNELLADDDALWLVQMLDAAGVTPADLREVGAAFGTNWDRIRPPDRPFEPAPLQIDGLVARGSALCARRRECSDPGDKALARFGQLEEFVARLRWARNDAEALGVLLDAEDSRHGVPKIGTRRRGTGQAQNWKDIASVREDFTALRVHCTEAAAEALQQVISAWCSHVARFTLEAAEQRRANGRLEFHDLLVRARDLLKSSHDARDSLHRRYRHLLLDEFQDTDPIQIEIATRIAAVVDADEPVPDGWQHIDTVDGQLFFVGDPKQSIYRFRRADISLYLDARDRFASSQPAAALVTNFRTTEPIIDWVNHTFDRLMAARGSDPADQLAPAAHDAGAEPPAAAGTAPQHSERLHPEYAPMHASRSAVGQGPAVVALGLSGHRDLSAQGIRDAEAADIAGVITEILANQWSVEDRHRGGERPARLGDIAILIPTRTCLPQLEAGLTAAQVPYRLDASEFVWRSRTVRDLLMCLRAVADPDDALAVVSALRTPLYGCGDDDLYTYYCAVGSWSLFASDFSAVPDGAEHPVAAGMQHLRRLYDEHALAAPSVLLDRLVRERRVLEQAAAGRRTREVWRHVRYVIDQARAWSHSQHGGLRQFLRWAAMQASERAKVTEAILPESDDDSVRVMTIHAAKGLEFPIVIVAGLQGGNRSRPSLVGFTGADRDGLDHCCGAAAVRLRAGAETAGYALWAEREKAADHFERIRLMYVACTRARDHLIVSLHRPLPPANEDSARQPRSKPSAQLLFEAMPRLGTGTVASERGWDYREVSGDAT
ncbi:UvrD-helicase domain-containing protein, partial [Candidatus Poriferisodalis sp.]